jgi:hypothetical protein
MHSKSNVLLVSAPMLAIATILMCLILYHLTWMLMLGMRDL